MRVYRATARRVGSHPKSAWDLPNWATQISERGRPAPTRPAAPSRSSISIDLYANPASEPPGKRAASLPARHYWRRRRDSRFNAPKPGHVLVRIASGTVQPVPLPLSDLGNPCHMESVTPYLLIAVFVVFSLARLLRRPRRPQGTHYNCAKCRKTFPHDPRTIGAWRMGKERFYCGPCHRAWLATQPRRPAEASGMLGQSRGCLGVVLWLLLPVGVILAWSIR